MRDGLDVDLTMDELMRRWPATIRVLLDFKMGCVGCPIAGFHTLGDACEEHGIDPDHLLQALEDVKDRPPTAVETA